MQPQVSVDWLSEKMREETFWEMAPSHKKCELHNGIMIMTSPATALHQTLEAFLLQIMGIYVSEKGLGIVLGSRYAIRLSPERIYEPDILFISNERMHLFTNEKLLGAPDVSVEIISPDSRRYDSIEKRRVYEEAAVKEYWVIDQYRRRADFYRHKGNRFKHIEVKDIFQSEAIAGFYLRLEWLWSQPGKFPKVLDVLRELLG